MCEFPLHLYGNTVQYILNTSLTMHTVVNGSAVIVCKLNNVRYCTLQAYICTCYILKSVHTQDDLKLEIFLLQDTTLLCAIIKHLLTNKIVFANRNLDYPTSMKHIYIVVLFSLDNNDHF